MCAGDRRTGRSVVDEIADTGPQPLSTEELVPRLANAAAIILGGAFIAFLLFTCAFVVAHYDSWIPALVPAFVGFLGVPL